MKFQKNKILLVYPIPDGWAVRHNWKLKIVKKFPNKEDAIVRALEIAENQNSIVQVKNKKGKFVIYQDKGNKNFNYKNVYSYIEPSYFSD